MTKLSTWWPSYHNNCICFPAQIRQFPRKIFKEDADHTSTFEECGLTSQETLLYTTVECEWLLFMDRSVWIGRVINVLSIFIVIKWMHLISLSSYSNAYHISPKRIEVQVYTSFCRFTIFHEFMSKTVCIVLYSKLRPRSTCHVLSLGIYAYIYLSMHSNTANHRCSIM